MVSTVGLSDVGSQHDKRNVLTPRSGSGPCARQPVAGSGLEVSSDDVMVALVVVV